MPDMIPVGNTIIPQNPMTGINSLSGIIGLQQQKQNLQTGQYQQQTAQADAQQSQQKNRELQALSQFTSAAIKDPKYHNSDGSLNTQQFQNDALQVAPVYGPPQIGQVTSNAKEAVEVRKAVQGLSADQAKQISGGLMDEANNANSTPTTFLNKISQLRSMNPTDPGYNRMLDNLLMSADRGNTQQTAARAAATFGGLSSKQPSQMDVGGAVQPGTTTAFGPGQGSFAAQGAPVGKVLGPAEQPGYLAKKATVEGAASGQVGTDNQVFSKVMASGANSQRGIELAQRIQQEAAGVRTGQYTQDFANRLTVLKQNDPSATDRQLLQKDAQNLKTLAEEGASSDAEREQIGGGFPSPDTMNPAAIQKASRYWEGAFHMAGARRDNAVAHVSQNGSTAGLSISDSQFMKGSSPGRFAPPEPPKTMPTGAKLTNYATTHFGGDTAKATEFLKQNGYQ